MFIFFLLILLVLYAIYYVITIYNEAIPLVEQCKNYSSNIQTEQKRKIDLFNSFLETILNGSDFERNLVTEVVKIRSNTNLSTDEKLARVKGMFSNTESNPSVNSTALYLTFQQNISETEDRIQNSKALYNQSVSLLNSFVRQFPSNLACKILRIQTEEYAN